MISYKTLKDRLPDFRKIVITGPHRSGTTIASHIIAEDLDYQHVDEKSVRWRSLNLLSSHLRTATTQVIHAPCFSSMAHWIDTPDTCVVFMRRDPKEIQASQDRIRWTGRHEVSELKQYFLAEGDEVSLYGMLQHVLPRTVYRAWDDCQKDLIQIPYFDLEYESLSDHPLWVAKENRANFKNRQWKES